MEVMGAVVGRWLGLLARRAAARGWGAAKYAAVCPEETETEVGGGGGRREEEEGGDPASRANV